MGPASYLGTCGKLVLWIVVVGYKRYNLTIIGPRWSKHNGAKWCKDNCHKLPRNTKCSPLYEWPLAAVKSGCPAQLTNCTAHGLGDIQQGALHFQHSIRSQKNDVFTREFLSGSCGNYMIIFLYCLWYKLPCKVSSNAAVQETQPCFRRWFAEFVRSGSPVARRKVWTHGVDSGISGIGFCFWS